MVGFQRRSRVGKRVVIDASVSNELEVVLSSQRLGSVNRIDGGLWRGVEALFDRDIGSISTQEGNDQGQNFPHICVSLKVVRTWPCLLNHIARALSSPFPSQKPGVEASSQALPDTILIPQGRLTREAIICVWSICWFRGALSLIFNLPYFTRLHSFRSPLKK